MRSVTPRGRTQNIQRPEEQAQSGKVQRSNLSKAQTHAIGEIVELSSSDEEDFRPGRKRARDGANVAGGKVIGEIVELSSSDEEDFRPGRKRARDSANVAGGKVSLNMGLTLSRRASNCCKGAGSNRRARNGCKGAGSNVSLDKGVTLRTRQVGTTPPQRNYRRFVVVECELCRDSGSKVCEGLYGCDHRFCFSCLKNHVTGVVKETIDPPDNRSRNLMPGLVLCPSLAGCSRELTRQEVARVIGKQEMDVFEDWLVKASDRIYSGNSLRWPMDSMKMCIVPRCGAMTAVKSKGTISFWKCATCQVTWCDSCGRQFRNSNPDVHANCTGARRLELYSELLGVETMWRDFAEVTKPEAKKVSKGKQKGGGTGYGGSAREFSAGQAAAQRREVDFHRVMEKHCAVLRNMLDRCSTQGRLNPATWALLQRAGTLAKLISHLMSNDSILDISSKSSCYLEVMALLRNLGLHDGLLPELLVVPTQQLSEDGPLFFCSMAKLYEQSKLMLSRLPDGGQRVKLMLSSGAQSVAAEDVDIQLALKLCESYEILKEQWAKHGYKTQQCGGEQNLQDAIQVSGGKGKSEGNASYNQKMDIVHDRISSRQVGLPAIASRAGPLETVIAEYKKKLQPLQFRSMSMVDKVGQYTNYQYVHDIANNSSKYTNRRRMLSIAKELASLATSLPLEWGSSIYLCVDEARTDVMKALIVGPHGTPYQNGIFIFDVLLPADYPHVPPKVHFLTTGAGRVRFNPNLYANGYVCLSLLGTWHTGPSWIPGRSTLLQVLVSLQSLIFVEEPYYNEPGFEKHENAQAAEAHNAHLRKATLSIAVLAALEKPEPLFADIILEHFRFKREEVEAQCDDWVKKGAQPTIVKSIKNEFLRLFG